MKENKGKIVVLILDNPKTHHSIKTVTKAKELGIILVFLPPYSPDLNPVEYVWKTIKRKVSVTFVQSKQHLRNIIKKEFIRVENSENSLSFAKRWMETFHQQIKSVIC